MKQLSTYILIAAAICFNVIVGAAVYTHIAEVPVWKQAPPASLKIFQGEYAIQSDNFWMFIHPVTITFLIAALVTNWKSIRKKYILFHIAGYVLTIILTFIYYVPELHDITSTPIQSIADQKLVSRAATWEMLSLIRLAFIIFLAGILLYSLTKPARRGISTN